jgi:alpha-galactosidase
MRATVSWGYEFIKHDFSTYELLGRWGFEMGASPSVSGWDFADRSQTNAEIIVSLYRGLRQTAGEKTILLGCNTIGHLAAGIFESQRIGDDTSGQIWERTRRMGVNALAFRMAQHRTFSYVDPDCVAITQNIDWSYSKQWLDLVARSGTSLFISPQPEAIGPEQKSAIKEAFQWTASSAGFAEDWYENTTPQRWRFHSAKMVKRSYDWFAQEGAFPFSV